MIIEKLEISQHLPEAFRDRTDIEYVLIQMREFEYTNWGIYVLIFSSQIPKGFRDLSALLYRIFTEYFPIAEYPPGKFQISMGDDALAQSGWQWNGGNWRNDETDDFQVWDKHSYRKYLWNKK